MAIAGRRLSGYKYMRTPLPPSIVTYTERAVHLDRFSSQQAHPPYLTLYRSRSTSRDHQAPHHQPLHRLGTYTHDEFPGGEAHPAGVPAARHAAAPLPLPRRNAGGRSLRRRRRQLENGSKGDRPRGRLRPHAPRALRHLHRALN
uniref:Uncharacterized protein n=1 Tax=Setaria viridis TaxID=4556 RepID=A0A4V6D6P0_SETVI|nr:hypothetical protein SEVIR_5G216725v2 [Setaria viridis]